MRLLLDTNIVIFLTTDRDRLSNNVAALLDDYDNQLYMSAESLKEMIVAFRRKRMGYKIWKDEITMIRSIKRDYLVEILPVTSQHMETYAELDLNVGEEHNDPSDHVIISHAISEHLPLVSADRKFPFYRGQGLVLITND